MPTQRPAAARRTVPPARRLPGARKLAPKHRHPPARKPPCRHCGHTRWIKYRGLCGRCYYDPDIRKQYGPVDARGRRNEDNFRHGRPMPEPTDAPPGSMEKAAVIGRRSLLGQALWHPLDAE
jgi:hypothetical protein